ncbi:MAG: DNA polymerase, partial [Clostridia bacterium]|nr:DNA polymerase [Clostridia bacterium]
TKIIANLKAGYKGLETWQRKVKTNASIRGYSETYLGRRRYLPGINSADWGKKSFAQRCALNTPIQGTAADILKIAITKILKGINERMWLRPILQVHDELVFELPTERINEAVNFIQDCMEQQPFPDFDVPLVAEGAVGKTFGTLKDILCSGDKIILEKEVR